MEPFEYNLGSIFRQLDMDYSNGLIDIDTVSSDTSAFQRYFFEQAKEKLKINAIYFLRDSDGTPKIPMIYFSAMDTYDPEKIANLHKLAWNMGEAPLLFVVIPDQLLVYNNYVPPAPAKEDGTYEVGLFARIKRVSNLETQRRELLRFHRAQMETGEFWRRNRKRFDINKRVDTTLMNNLRVIRKFLLNKIQERDIDEKIDSKHRSEIVHSLLGRSILIEYLEERMDSQGRTVFPPDFFGESLDGAKRYVDVLNDKKATYTLFKKLEERFNGDMFPLVEYEEDVITQADLIELREFLLGTSDLASQQMVLWSQYSFNVIPIQLISSIYELFFHLAETDVDKEKGTYYTPYHLVSMLMDEVLPWEGVYEQKRILDPACGSGIFLVEAYRRLVARWMYTNNLKSVEPHDLETILTSCIFGVDCNREAIRIASFSLSLVMCDFLEPRTIWNELQFPQLISHNLFHNDFFESGCFEQIPYDIVIGNPPWESRLSLAAKDYIKRSKSIVSDNQIAQAFSWRAGEVCPRGVICLLLPSKGFLFNRSSKAHQFRMSFFNTFNVSVIINFSAYRKALFEHAVGPAVGVIYQAAKAEDVTPIFYCTPKPLYTIEDRRHFLIEPNNICRIPRDLISDDLIWRIAMWGGPRDMDLIHTIQAAGRPLRELLDKNGMIYAEGYKKGNKRKECRAFIDMPLLDAKTFVPGKHSDESLPKMCDWKLECTVDTKREIFKGPHLIIKQSHKGARFLADVLDFDAVFNHSFLGIYGDARLLKYFCIIISSKVFAYYQMMTNRKWFVERDESEAGDILSTPFPAPLETAIEEAVALFEAEVVCGDERSYVRIDDFACRQYGLSPHEIKLIDDATDYLYDYYSKGKHSVSLKRANNGSLKTYSDALQSVLKNTLGRNIPMSCCVHCGDAPLVVAVLNLSGQMPSQVAISETTEELNQLLYRLDAQLTEERSESVFVKRNVRIYEKDCIYLIKPNQARYWNYSSACRDADEIYADVMRAWRDENEQYS